MYRVRRVEDLDRIEEMSLAFLEELRIVAAEQPIVQMLASASAQSKAARVVNLTKRSGNTTERLSMFVTRSLH